MQMNIMIVLSKMCLVKLDLEKDILLFVSEICYIEY